MFTDLLKVLTGMVITFLTMPHLMSEDVYELMYKSLLSVITGILSTVIIHAVSKYYNHKKKIENIEKCSYIYPKLFR